jgi:DNA-directed RNA polymerase omega subunit
METESMEKILEKIDNRYEAIRVIAKEARRINTLIRLSGEEVEEKPTTIAVSRTIEGKVKYTYAQQEEQE